MEERKVYHVVPGPGGRWQIEEEGADSATSLHDKKEDALARARELATSRPPSQVVVHKQDGTIQTEYTYQDDPYPPKG